jgi:hypothetical protein
VTIWLSKSRRNETVKYYFSTNHDYAVIHEVSAYQLARCIDDLKRYGYKSAAATMERLRDDAKARSKTDVVLRPDPVTASEAKALSIAASATHDIGNVLTGLGEREGLFLQWAQGRNGLKLKRCCSECKRPL